MGIRWTADRLLEMVRGFQAGCVVIAAAELDLVESIGSGARTARALAAALRCDLRMLTIELDALSALGLLEKRGERYSCAPGVKDLLTANGSGCVRAMVRHLGNCARRWTQLAPAIRSGRQPARRASMLGAKADLESFIGAMNDISLVVAPGVVADLGDLRFRRLLDVGGGPGTWTIEFLRRHQDATAILFDLPKVTRLAAANVRQAGLSDRVRFVAGDFCRDPLPCGADLAWVSAIVHQNSRAQNLRLFRSVFAALVPGGSILVRDVIMDPSRTSPVMGALFAVNMLVGTPAGGTFTLAELGADLREAGFTGVRQVRSEPGMSSVVLATRPRLPRGKPRRG